MQIFDTHTHLNVEEFAGREQEELELAKELGVIAHNVVGFDKPTIERAIALADQHPEVYLTLGWHPTEAGDYSPEVEAYLLEQLKHPKVVALGEIGLDYHWIDEATRLAGDANDPAKVKEAQDAAQKAGEAVKDAKQAH